MKSNIVLDFYDHVFNLRSNRKNNNNNTNHKEQIYVTKNYPKIGPNEIFSFDDKDGHNDASNKKVNFKKPSSTQSNGFIKVEQILNLAETNSFGTQVGSTKVILIKNKIKENEDKFNRNRTISFGFFIVGSLAIMASSKISNEDTRNQFRTLAVVTTLFGPTLLLTSTTQHMIKTIELSGLEGTELIEEAVEKNVKSITNMMELMLIRISTIIALAAGGFISYRIVDKIVDK